MEKLRKSCFCLKSDKIDSYFKVLESSPFLEIGPNLKDFISKLSKQTSNITHPCAVALKQGVI